MVSQLRRREAVMINNCPFKPKDRNCRLELDYIVLQETLQETEETCRQLLDENRYLWNRLDKIESVLAEHGISMADI